MLHLIHMHRGEAMHKLKSIRKQKGKKKKYIMLNETIAFFLLNENVGIKTSTSKVDWLKHDSMIETVTSIDHQVPCNLLFVFSIGNFG